MVGRGWIPPHIFFCQEWIYNKLFMYYKETKFVVTKKCYINGNPVVTIKHYFLY